LTNNALREANIETRVDHRSLEAQGIDRQPVVHVPLEFYRQQVKGLDPEGITRMRAQYKAWIDSGRSQVSRRAQASPEVQKTPRVEAREHQSEALAQRTEILAAPGKLQAHPAQASAQQTRESQSLYAQAPGRQAQPPCAERPDLAPQNPRTEPEPPAAPRTLAEIRRDAVQNWLRMRSKGVESPGNESNRQRANDVSSTRGQGEDLGK
jgi:hypothetical protein